MRSIDLTPIYRTTVGFDRMAQMLDGILSAESAQPGYPPYNIEKTGETDYRITLAVAGFEEADLSIEAREGQLIVIGAKSRETEQDERHFLHRGIAERGFERRFQLAEHVRVSGAKLENGLLHIDLVREVPEALKPRRIAITNGATKAVEAA